MQNDLNKKVAQAAKWSSITEIATKMISPITNAILARILVPEAFGVVATLMMVITFAEIFTDAGFQKYLVQREFKDEDDLNLSTNVAFWTNIIFSALVWAIIAVYATPIAKMVGSEGYELAIIVISAEIPLLAFSSIQMARYRRDFNFKNLFVARIAVAVVPLVVTVPLALYFHSHWALVIGTLAKDLLNAVVLTVKSRWKPSFRYSFDKLKQMLSFSLWTIVENVSIWLSMNVGTFAVSTLFGAYYLGLFKTTVTIINSCFSILSYTVTPVLFAALSRCQNDDIEYRGIFFKFQRMAALLALPLGFGLFTYREMATMILLGAQWTETADFVGMTALKCALVFVFSNFNSEAFRSKGKPILSVLAQVIYLIALVPALYLGALIDYTTLTISSTLASGILIVATFVISHIVLKISIVAVLKNVLPSLLSSVIMAVAGWWLRTLMTGVIWELATIVLCVFVYAGCMLLLPSGRRQLAEIPILKKLLPLEETSK